MCVYVHVCTHVVYQMKICFGSDELMVQSQWQVAATSQRLLCILSAVCRWTVSWLHAVLAHPLQSTPWQDEDEVDCRPALSHRAPPAELQPGGYKESSCHGDDKSTQNGKLIKNNNKITKHGNFCLTASSDVEWLRQYTNKPSFETISDVSTKFKPYLCKWTLNWHACRLHTRRIWLLKYTSLYTCVMCRCLKQNNTGT